MIYPIYPHQYIYLVFLTYHHIYKVTSTDKATLSLSSYHYFLSLLRQECGIAADANAPTSAKPEVYYPQQENCLQDKM